LYKIQSYNLEWERRHVNDSNGRSKGYRRETLQRAVGNSERMKLLWLIENSAGRR
jgi:hypothetical protein